MGVPFQVLNLSERLPEAIDKLLPDAVDRLIVQDLESPGEEIAEQRVRQHQGVKGGPALEEHGSLVSQFQPALKLIQQA